MSISERVGICFRAIGPADRQALHAVVGDVGVFEPHEIDVAEELSAAALAGSPDYAITVARKDARIRRHRPGPSWDTPATATSR